MRDLLHLADFIAIYEGNVTAEEDVQADGHRSTLSANRVDVLFADQPASRVRFQSDAPHASGPERFGISGELSHPGPGRVLVTASRGLYLANVSRLPGAVPLKGGYALLGTAAVLDEGTVTRPRADGRLESMPAAEVAQIIASGYR